MTSPAALIPLLALALDARVARTDDDGLAYVLQAVNQSMTASCEAELRPDRAVVVGGLSASALKPSEATAVLDRLVAASRRFVEERGGQLNLLERTRAVRSTPRDPAQPQAPAPFVTVQRLEAEVPAEQDVDVLLEGLLKLGLDQYGRELVLDPSAEARHGGYRPAQAVVRYRISRLRERVAEIHDQCRLAALAAWCATAVPHPEREACAAALGRIADRFATQAFTLRARPLPGADGGAAAFHVSSASLDPDGRPRFDLAGSDPGSGELDLLGLVRLRLSGSIGIVLVGAR
jgi:hypothetical protein